VTDEEFERLDAKARRFLRRGRRIPSALGRLLARCRDCDCENREFYMIAKSLWLQSVPSGRGCLCLACLAKRLGRPLVAADFTDAPVAHPDEQIE
jgi:hypothetical protein